MASNGIILIDLIGELVDKMRATGSITSSSEVSTLYTIISTNELRDGEVINIDDVEYIIINPTDNQFEITAETGLDFAGKSWKALAPYYDHGVKLEMVNTLKEKSNGIYQWKKYPLIMLFQPFSQPRDVETNALFATASPNMAIVNFTKPNIKAAERYDLNYRTILYPLYYSLLEQFSKSGNFNTKGINVFDHNPIENLYYGESGENGNIANKFDDPLDAIEIIDTVMKVNNQNC